MPPSCGASGSTWPAARRRSTKYRNSSPRNNRTSAGCWSNRCSPRTTPPITSAASGRSISPTSRPFEQGDYDGRQISRYLRDAWLAGRELSRRRAGADRRRRGERCQRAGEFPAQLQRAARAAGRRGQQKIPRPDDALCRVPRSSLRRLEAAAVLGPGRPLCPAAADAAHGRARGRQLLAGRRAGPRRTADARPRHRRG